MTDWPSIESHIAWLKQELDDLDQGLRQTLRQSPIWREKDDLSFFRNYDPVERRIFANYIPG